MAFDGSDLLGFASAVGLVVFGLLVLRIGRRAGPAVLFGAFATMWGIQVGLIKAAELWDYAGPGLAFQAAATAFIIPLYLFFGHFACIYPTRLAVTRRAWWLPLLSLPALATTAVVLLDASAGARGEPVRVWGWAMLLLPFVPFVGALLLGLVRFARGALRSEGGPEGRQHLIATVGLLVYLWNFLLDTLFVAYVKPDSVSSLGPWGLAVYLGTVLAGLAVCMATSARLASTASGHERILWVAAVVVPVATALPRLVYVDWSVVGFWRLLMIGLFAYGIARYRLFDLELRVRRRAASFAAVAIGATSWGLLSALASVAWGLRLPGDAGPFAALGLAGAGAGLLAYRPLSALLDRAFPHLQADEEYLLRRKCEVYQAARLAGAEGPALQRVADELRLRPEERAVLDYTSPRRAARGLGDRYHIQQMLAQGAHGAVFLAWDARVGERVVLKQYVGRGASDPSRGFLREAKALGDLRHPNVVAVRDVFRAGRDAYVSLEYAPEGTLGDRLAGGAALPVAEALEIARQVLAGLGAAHRRGVVHRDVKPANVLFKRGQAKLADFGVAQDPVLDLQRAAGWQPGTVAYMSPEQVRGEPVTAASDVYAMGALLYRMLAGRHYFPLDGLDERRARAAIQSRPPDLPIGGVPAEVNALLAQALAKDPAARPADAAAMLRRLERVRRRLRWEAMPARARAAFEVRASPR